MVVPSSRLDATTPLSGVLRSTSMLIPVEVPDTGAPSLTDLNSIQEQMRRMESQVPFCCSLFPDNDKVIDATIMWGSWLDYGRKRRASWMSRSNKWAPFRIYSGYGVVSG